MQHTHIAVDEPESAIRNVQEASVRLLHYVLLSPYCCGLESAAALVLQWQPQLASKWSVKHSLLCMLQCSSDMHHFQAVAAAVASEVIAVAAHT
jgi:hypothetical protein